MENGAIRKFSCSGSWEFKKNAEDKQGEEIDDSFIPYAEFVM